MRDPQPLLLLPLLARAHRHVRILRISPVHHTIFSVPESRLAPQTAKLNIANDANLDRLAEQVRTSLLVDPKYLRTSECIRTNTANAADAIAQQMFSYMAGYTVPSGSSSLSNVLATGS